MEQKNNGAAGAENLQTHVGIVACSDGLDTDSEAVIRQLVSVLEGFGKSVHESPYIYKTLGPFSGTGPQRAQALMDMFMDQRIGEIYDVSGGDLANEILDELDYNKIQKSKAVFWGYSDLTTVINAIYTMTGRLSVLYQIRNLVGPRGSMQQARYTDRTRLFDLDYEMIRGSSMEGIVVGGNIRCFLKLAGTRYFPDLSGKILLLEAMGGQVPQMVTYLHQLKQMGAFEQIKGILLGTFSAMEASKSEPDMTALVQMYVGEHIPVARTRDIGHGKDAKAIVIGKEYKF